MKTRSTFFLTIIHVQLWSGMFWQVFPLSNNLYCIYWQVLLSVFIALYILTGILLVFIGIVYIWQVLPSLLLVLDDNGNPRVQAHAGAALVNFCEECPKHILAPYLDSIIQKLAEVCPMSCSKDSRVEITYKTLSKSSFFFIIDNAEICVSCRANWKAQYMSCNIWHDFRFVFYRNGQLPPKGSHCKLKVNRKLCWVHIHLTSQT